MSCDDFWSMFLLYNGQELDAFGWAFQGNYDSPRYEHPTADVLGVSHRLCVVDIYPEIGNANF